MFNRYTAALLYFVSKASENFGDRLWVALLPLLLRWMRHPGTKQHTSKVMHVAHAARIARKIITATMRATLIVDRVCSSM
jgi:hypothetical protein